MHERSDNPRKVTDPSITELGSAIRRDGGAFIRLQLKKGFRV